jgi:hypothetical protein
MSFLIPKATGPRGQTVTLSEIWQMQFILEYQHSTSATFNQNCCEKYNFVIEPWLGACLNHVTFKILWLTKYYSGPLPPQMTSI